MSLFHFIQKYSQPLRVHTIITTIDTSRSISPEHSFHMIWQMALFYSSQGGVFMSAEASTSTPQPESLRANSIGLPGVLFQSITTMAPASAVAFSLAAAIPFTGGALPLATIIALIVCLLVALNIGSMAKHLPSAVVYFTYVSRVLGSQSVWITSWRVHLTYLLLSPLT